MKKSILISFLFCLIDLIAVSQTKKTTTTTTTKTPVKTTTKATTTKTVVKPPVTPAPVIEKKEIVPAPAVVQEPASPPNTGKTVDGPKSYSNTGQTSPSTTISKTTKTTKTVVAKVDKPKEARSKPTNESVRSYFGIRGGYNLSTAQDLQKIIDATITNTAKVKDLPGYMGGLVFNIGVSKAFSIQPEVLYSQQGVQITDSDKFLKYKLDVVNVPLLLKLAFGSPKVKFFINAGPYVGYKIGQTQESNLGGTLISEKKDFITDYDASGQKDNRIDFGGIGGAGFQFNLGGPLLVLEGRYQYGMADPTLYKDGKPAEVGDLGHTRVMTGTLGLLFPLGK